MDIELAFLTAGHIFCLIATSVLFFSRHKFAGMLLFLGFFMRIQALLLFNFVDAPKMISDCSLPEGGGLYGCLSIWFKLSIHGGQIGDFLVGFGVLWIALFSRKPCCP